jgi:hypothetical protein
MWKFVLAFTVGTILSLSSHTAAGQVQEQPQGDQAKHSAGVDIRGDHAMGFSHENSMHHFHLFSDGGAIEVVAIDPKDEATRDQIRMHLAHIAQMFNDGNFNVPMFIHDKTPPGVPIMQAKKDAIHYRFEQTSMGGQVRITSADSDALTAIHQFLVFQIQDHRTGDPTTVRTAN